MSAIPKKVVDRLVSEIPKFQKVLKTASDRDINEADTVTIVSDILADVCGFDRYLEITSEFAVRNTYCDLAVKIDDEAKYLIEVKAIGISLKENHLRQAVNYGANQGIHWVILTNGIVWNIYKLRLDKAVNFDLVCEINFLDVNPRKKEDQEILYLLCKEGLVKAKAAMAEYHERMQSINRFVLGAIIMNDKFIDSIRRELRKITPGLRVENSEIESILRSEVIKRDVIEGEPAQKATQRINRTLKKTKKTNKEE